MKARNRFMTSYNKTQNESLISHSLTATKKVSRQIAIGAALFLLSFALQMAAQSSPTQIEGSGWTAETENAPAVASDGNNLYAAWKGATTNNIYFSINSGSGWSDQTIVGGSDWTAGTSAAPALAFVSGTNVWLAWRGESAGHVWISMWDGSSWSTQQEVQGTNWVSGTSAAPAVTYSEGLLFIAWKGTSGNRIWYSTFNGSEFATQQVVGTSGWTADSSAGPTFQQSTALIYKGVSTNVWEALLPEPSWTTQNQIVCNDPNFTAMTSTTPAATVLFAANGPTNSFTYPVFWKGASGNSIWYTYSVPTGCGWANQATVKGSDSSGNWSASTNAAPAAASATIMYEGYGAPLAILAWKNSSDNTIWYLDPTTLPGLSGTD
jgi:hypothetical protein